MQEKPRLDEDSFQQLLAAAYVLQEQNATSPASPARPDYSQTLAEIVETQSLIQTRQLDLTAASALIAERVWKLTGATAAAVGVVDGEDLKYCACSGNISVQSGSRVPLGACLSARSLSSGQPIESPEAENDPRLSRDLCREQNVRSLIAIPVYYQGKVSGVLELRFARTAAFQEQDLRTCQLMAGLLTEAIARAADADWKQSLALERAKMLEVLDKIKPQLERFAQQPAAPEAPTPEPPKEVLTEACRACGNLFEAEESFCGICGTARSVVQPASGDMQSKWASLWYMQQASGKKQGGEAEVEVESPDLASDSSSPSLEGHETPASTPDHESASELRIVPAENTAAQGGMRPTNWSSAERARNWLDSLKSEPSSNHWFTKIWRTQRANLYLATAVILLLAALTGWGTRSQPDANIAQAAASTSRRRKPAPPKLTFFERALVSLGLAEPPPAPVYLGNPEVQVWEDVHTALYYCPGADLYGKTAGGKLTTQRDAQQDQFEPALRKPCE